MNMRSIPMHYEIDEAAQLPDDSLNYSGSSVALDRDGEFRGYGFGDTG
jgi:hypothetical protein